METKAQDIKARLRTAERNGSLTLSNSNLPSIPAAVFQLKNLIRLDLSFNGITTLSTEIRNLNKLKQLWLNDNPLSEVPQELSYCTDLETIDLSNTRISNIPRDIGKLPKLLEINLRGCPLKETISNIHEEGVASIVSHLRRKLDRRDYREKLFKKLKEQIYTEVDVLALMEVTIQIFNILRDYTTNDLKILLHNTARIFPDKFEAVSPDMVRQKLDEIKQEMDKRNEISKITLKLKARYPDTDLYALNLLATSMHSTLLTPEINEVFRKNMLPDECSSINVQTLSSTLRQ